MSLFAIADLHLSLGSDKPMDIFSGWENYTEKIKENWLKLVKPTDTVVIAGDVSWSMSLENARNDFDFINNLPGKKLIIKGNHDYWWETAKKMNKFFTENGYDTIKIIHNSMEKVDDIGNYAVCGTRGWFVDESADKKVLNREVGRLDTSITLAEKAGLEPLVFLHYPPVTSSYRCEEIYDVLKAHNIKRVYFGHLHGKAAENALEGEYDGMILRLISCDHTGFSPVIIEKSEL